MFILASIIVFNNIIKAAINNKVIIIKRDYKGNNKLRLFVNIIFDIINFSPFIKVVLIGFVFNLIILPLYFLTYSLVLLSLSLSSLIFT
jgi:hypothetical protein